MGGSPTERQARGSSVGAESGIAAVLRALRYAAVKHRNQRRKGAGAPPFVNHAIEVAELLARVAGVTDPVVLQAAALHDTIEDTSTTEAELRREFGARVAGVVAEVSDDKRLPFQERKHLQVQRAPSLSREAQLVRLADKIVNVGAIARTPPVGWSLDRRREYVEWAVRVVEGCRGTDAALERAFDAAVAEARAILEGENE